MSAELIRDGKRMAAIGALLEVLLFPALIGQVLWLVAMSKLSQAFNDRSVFRNALVWFLLPIVFGVVGVIFYLFVIGGFVIVGQVVDMYSMDNLLWGFGFFFVGVVFVLLVWGMTVVSNIYQAKVCRSLAKYFGDSLFSTAATLFTLGGWLSIIFVGVILIWVAWIIVMTASFKEKEAEGQA